MAWEGMKVGTLGPNKPVFCAAIDDPDSITAAANILKVRDEMHRRLFPEQYNKAGRRVRDFYGDPIAS